MAGFNKTPTTFYPIIQMNLSQAKNTEKSVQSTQKIYPISLKNHFTQFKLHNI
jgi:hypothetical protein